MIEYWIKSSKLRTLRQIFSFFFKMHYCTYSSFASLTLSLPVMDRCKSSQSCSDSPISPNLICLKDASPLLSSPLPSSALLSSPLLLSFSPLFHFSLFVLSPHKFHSHSLPLSSLLRRCTLFSHSLLVCLPLPPLPTLCFPPVSHLKALSYLLEWKSSFTICLIKCVFNPMGDILFF